MLNTHFGNSRKNKSHRSSFDSNNHTGISHQSIHDSMHKKDFHNSIHDRKKIHESMHFGKDRIISPLNHKIK